MINQWIFRGCPMFFDKTNVWDMPDIVNLATETWVKISGCDPKKIEIAFISLRFYVLGRCYTVAYPMYMSTYPLIIKHGLLENATFTVIK